MEDRNKIEKLFNIITELDARESSNNVVSYQDATWNELCDMAIEYLKELKSNDKTI